MTILAIKQADQHKKTLKSVVYKEFLRKAMIPILLIEVALIAFYFITVNYMTDKSVDIMAQTAQQSLKNLSDVEARHIDNKFEDIRFKSQVMYEQHQIPMGTGYATLAEEVIPEDLPWKLSLIHI